MFAFVWVFCLLKVQKFNLSHTLALDYTKATQSRVGLVSCPFYNLILQMTCSWNLHQRYFKKKILFSGIISSHTRGFFWFQNVANYIQLKRAKFLTSTLLILKKLVKSLTLFLIKKCTTVTIDFTNRKFIG